jgi:hypothetical protein
LFTPVDAEVLQVQKQSALSEVFRLEYRRVYNVKDDLAEFEKWKRGEKTAADDPDNSYWQEVRALRDRGVRSRRIRVVDFPIGDYLKYEIDFYRGSEANGEEIFFLERAPTIDCMQSTVVVQDFWLFDGDVVLLWKYGKDGKRDGQEEARDADTVRPYVQLRDCLEAKALSMSDFIKRYPKSFSADHVSA